MWIFLNNSFISIVAERNSSTHYRVRARLRGDIERAIPYASVFEPKHSDYRFHATVDRMVVATVVRQQLGAIEYSDFKGSIDKSPEGDARYSIYTDVWGVMASAQLDEIATEKEGLNTKAGSPDRRFDRMVGNKA